MVTLPPPEVISETRAPITAQVFFEELTRSADPSVREFADWVIHRAEEDGLEVDWREAGPVLKYVDQESGRFFTLGQLHRNGKLTETYRLFDRFRELKLPLEFCREYFDDVAALVPGASRRSFKTKGRGHEYEQVVYGANPGPTDYLPLAALAPHKEQWFAAIARVVDRIRGALSRQ
jgi:hypothetical protein